MLPSYRNQSIDCTANQLNGFYMRETLVLHRLATEPFKKYVTCIIAFFIPLTCVRVSQFYSITYFVLFTKNYEMRWDIKIWYIEILTMKWDYYSYLKYTDRLLDMFFLLLAVILSELYENPRRKNWVTEKSTQKNLCEGHHFFGWTSSFLCYFCYFFVFSLPLVYSGFT